MKIDLSGEWKFYAIQPEGNKITAPMGLKTLTPFQGTVPGNIELDLVANGMSSDPFYAENGRSYRKFEFYDFWYCKDFSVQPEMIGNWELVCEGVDCFAEYFLNGKLIGESENALIPHSFAIEIQEKNTLAIRIISPEIAARKYPDEPAAVARFQQVYSSLYTRKPAHVGGWDIAPRLSLGGIWKKVMLTKRDTPFSFSEVWVKTFELQPDQNTARVELFYSIDAGRHGIHDFTLEFSGQCRDSVFTYNSPAYFTSGRFYIQIPNVKLWYPRGYGEPNLYELQAKLMDAAGNTVAEHNSKFGVRLVQLDRSESTVGQGKFRFLINGMVVRVLGSNHVPLDALHSRDSERMEKVLDLFDELQCNMLRCWGGGVYESDEFYDYCDRRGIMVWQDFMFGCEAYPQNQTFFDLIRPEAEYTVRRLRRHTSLVLWCGDNECDQFYTTLKIPLQNNKLNREVLADIVRRLDPSRPYLPSSPYISEATEKRVQAGELEVMPERHLWGPRETFKLPYYANSRAKFISETGWHGCPNLSSMEKFLSPEHFHYDDKDSEWDFHASNPFQHNSAMATRSQLIGKQLQEYFYSKPANLQEYARYSQIHQAEALKFMVENTRLDHSCGGILWWNVIDCWPQFSDSVVDYYFGKKLAFYYLKRCQSPFCIMCSEPNPWESRITAVNDSNECAVGNFTLEDSHGIVLSGTFELLPGIQKVLGTLRSPRGRNELWLLRWDNRNVRGVNHYISGNFAMKYAWYMEALQKIAALDEAFDATELAL